MGKDFTLYESFAKTYKGHGTDFAIVGGIAWFCNRMMKKLSRRFQNRRRSRTRMIEFIEEKLAVDHPNTARITIR